jgi:uncharacterized protein
MEIKLNRFRVRKVDDKYFLSTDHGSFCLLDSQEYEKFKTNDFSQDDDLYKKLEEREIIITKNNELEIKRLMYERNKFLCQGTSLHIVVPTLRCNMNCIYCHASAKCSNDLGFDMTKDIAKKTVDFIFQTPSEAITIEFQGGEPLLNWDIVQYIIEYSQEKNKIFRKSLILTMVSNLSNMTDDKLRYLIDNNVDICTSLDGPKELHNKNRPISNGSNYDDVVFWIKKINKKYDKLGSEKKIGALVTLTKESLRYPKEIIDEYINLGLNSVHLRFLNHLGRSEVNDDIHYSVEDFIEFWKKSMSYILDKQKQGIKIEERMIQLMLDKITNEEDPGYLDLRSPCGAVIGQMAYDYDGSIYSCDEARMIGEDLFKVGDVNNNDYKEVLTCDNTCAIVNASILDNYSTCKICAYKPYCGVCPVCNYAEQGNVIGKISQTDRCKIYKIQFDWLVKNYLI